MLSILLRLWQAMGETKKLLQKILDREQAILDQLQQIQDILTPGPAVALVFTARFEDGTIEEGVSNVNLRDDQKVALTIQIVDKKGKPALVDGVPVWAGSDDTVLTVEAAADGMSAEVTAVAPGSGRVVVTADADLGAGVTDLTGTLDFTVAPGGAVAITITPGTPEDQ